MKTKDLKRFAKASLAHGNGIDQTRNMVHDIVMDQVNEVLTPEELENMDASNEKEHLEELLYLEPLCRELPYVLADFHNAISILGDRIEKLEGGNLDKKDEESKTVFKHILGDLECQICLMTAIRQRVDELNQDSYIPEDEE